MKRAKWAAWGLLLCILPFGVGAQVFRWVDEKGKVHYGDRPIAKEVREVPVLREARPAEAVLPAPGMKVEELRKSYGEPERVRTVRSRNGETLFWSYSKPKSFVVKIENGEVAEVATDSQATAATPPVVQPAQVQAKGTPAMAIPEQEPDGRRNDAQATRCEHLKERAARIQDAERRGGSAGSMDRLREERRRLSDQMFSAGCGSM
jgi:hypothetical protein